MPDLKRLSNSRPAGLGSLSRWAAASRSFRQSRPHRQGKIFMGEPVDGQSNSGQARDAPPRLPFSSRHSRPLTLLRYLWVLPATLFGLIAVALTAMTGGH